MLKLVVCILVWNAACCAQEHLTCLRVNDVLTQKSPETTQTTLQQGYPGKRGPKGLEGERGYPGQKGEPGVCDDVQIHLLQDRINSLFQEMKAIKNQSKDNQLQEQLNSISQKVDALTNQSRENKLQEQLSSLLQEVETLKNQSREYRQTDALNKTVYAPSPSYVYKVNSNLQSWQESRQFCQNWGGDLAVHGVTTLEERRKLMQNLSIDLHFWIGASDIASEGNWVWVNGEPAKSSELIWANGQPDGGVMKNCLVLAGWPNGPNIARAFDSPCRLEYLGICEKKR